MSSTINIPQTIADVAQQYGVDPSVALELATVESGLNPSAVSSKGAVGLFQVLPSTAGMAAAQLMDPATNIGAGIAYLASLLGQYGGDYSKALAAYNWGPGNVNGAISAAGANWFSSIPATVQNYVDEIMGNASSQYSVSAINLPVPTNILPTLDLALTPIDSSVDTSIEPEPADNPDLIGVLIAIGAALVFVAFAAG